MEATTRAAASVHSPDASISEVLHLVWTRRRALAIGAAIGAVLAVLPTFFQPATFTSAATVIPSGAQQPGDARLRGLASQFGLGNLPMSAGTGVASPDFILRIASSMVVGRRLLEDTLESAEVGGRRLVLDLIAPREAAAESPLDRERRVRRGLRKLNRWISLQKSAKLDAVDLQVSTPWPTVSLGLARQMLEKLNEFTLELGRESAHNERRFVQQRIADRDGRLRQAEARLAAFLRSNREFRTSPNLVFEHDRLQRDVDLHQQVLVNLVQSSEEAQIRELRDTPTLQVLEPPVLAPERDPKGRGIMMLVGMVAGTVVAALIVLFGGGIHAQRGTVSPAAGSEGAHVASG